MVKTSKKLLGTSKTFPRKRASKKTQVVKGVSQTLLYPKKKQTTNVKFGVSKMFQGMIVVKTAKPKVKKATINPPVIPARVVLPIVKKTEFEPIVQDNDDDVVLSLTELMLLKKADLQKLCDSYDIDYTPKDKKADLANKLVESGKL